MKINQHGLSRNIPAGVKRDIRIASGFGCVVCGSAIIDYEHIDPTFEHAKSHDAACMALLCPTCHGEVTRGFVSKELVKEAMKSPKALQLGFANNLFKLGPNHPAVTCGGIGFVNCFTLIQINGIEVLGIKPPESPTAPFRLSGIFHDSSGKLSLQIIDNEWRSFTSNWDVETTGGEIIVRESPRQVALKIQVDPGNGLIFEKIKIQYRKYKVEGDTKGLRFWNGNYWNEFKDLSIGNANIAFSMN